MNPQNQKIRVSVENYGMALNRTGRYPETPLARTKPPSVHKVDGRARILRPLRQAQGGMQTNQQPTTSSSGGPNRPGSSSMHHSQSMPVLQQAGASGPRPPSNQQSAARPLLTLPSNSTDKVISLIQWAEALKKQMERMRSVSKKALQHAQNDALTTADLSRVREGLTEIANVYNDMDKTSRAKCRMNTIFDKRILYKSVEAAIQRYKFDSPNALFDKLQESMDDKYCIERNILAVAENFRQMAVIPPRPSRFTRPPPITFSKHVEEGNKGVWKSMEAVLNKVKGDPMTWNFRRVSHPYYRNSKCLIQVHYCSRRPTGEKGFVPYMKAMIVLKYGILEDLVIGGEDEDLFDQERILQSRRRVYQEFTKSAREIILCSPVTKFTTPNNFAQCNNYIQMYVNCFSTKCFYCKKHLRQFMPPTVVTREASPIICHKLCQMVQVL